MPVSRPTRPERLSVTTLSVCVLAFGAWFVTLGADLRDGGHAVALAWRLSLGDGVFTDEMNVQALGALCAVPVTWLWTHLFGVSGLVLTSRVFYLLLSVLVGAVCYAALRRALAPMTAALAVLVPLLALPYQLPVLSYNTAPILFVLLALSTGMAALWSRRGRWAAVAGASAAAAAVSNPTMTPGAVLLLLCLVMLSRQKPVITGVLVGGMAVTVPFVAWLLLGPGPAAISDTLSYTLAYQADRPPPSTRWATLVDTFGSNLGSPRYWPMWALAAAASIPFLPKFVRGLACVLVPFAAAAVSLRDDFTTDPPALFGRPVGTLAIVVSLALVVPLTVFVLQERRRDLTRMLALSLPAAALQTPIIGATTSSGPLLGVAVIGATPALAALAAGWVEMVRTYVPGRAVMVTGPALVVVVAGVLALRPFYDPFPWQLTARITSGPYAGLSTSPEQAALFDVLRRDTQRWLRPGGTVLFYGTIPGGYLIADSTPRTNILWLNDFGQANTQTLRYFSRKGGPPDVVFVEVRSASRAGGWDELAARDPLMGFVLRNYRVADAGTGKVYRIFEAGDAGPVSR